MRIMAREHRAVIGAILEGRYRRDPDISQHETVSGRAHNGVGVQSKRRPAKTPLPQSLQVLNGVYTTQPVVQPVSRLKLRLHGAIR